MRDPEDDGPAVRVGEDAYGKVRLRPRPTRVRRGARARRRRLVLAGTLSSLVLAGSCASWALPTLAVRQIGSVDAGVRGSGPRGAMNILVVGVDKRDNLTRRQQNLLKLGRESGQRTDTMMIVHLSEDHRKITIVSLPRDTWVTVPGKGQHKINAAYQLGGPKLTVQTVENVTGLTINHYVEVNVLGFVDVVESLGGVSVCTPVPIEDPKTGLSLRPGTYELDGVKALAYARTRATARSDLDRIDRQQQVVSALLDRALSSGTLTNPVRLASFVNSTLKTLTVDERLAEDVLGLARQLRDVSTDDVTFASVPIADADHKSPTGESVVLWDAQAARDLFRRIAADEPLTEPSAEASAKPSVKASGGAERPASPTPMRTPLTVPPERIAVRVLNGTGITGRGAAARNDLLQAGFMVPEPAGNAATTDYDTTVIRYGPERRDSARTVAAAIPGAELLETASLGDRLEVVIGHRYSGVRKVTVEPSSPATPTPATSTPATKTATENICRD